MNSANQNISFRPFEKTDRQAIENIIRETWNYDSFCSAKVAKRMSRLFLSSCLMNQTFTCVALQNDIPIGVIMAKNMQKRSGSILKALHQFWSVLAIASSKEGRTVAKSFAGIERLDKDLLKNSNQQFDGELAFFAVSAKSRGTGVGKALFSRATAYMQSERVNNFFLYTDTSCNYGFYEHQGMKRLGQTKYELPQKKQMEFYIYGQQF